jgi:hypothetical protein
MAGSSNRSTPVEPWTERRQGRRSVRRRLTYNNNNNYNFNSIIENNSKASAQSVAKPAQSNSSVKKNAYYSPSNSKSSTKSSKVPLKKK